MTDAKRWPQRHALMQEQVCVRESVASLSYSTHSYSTCQSEAGDTLVDMAHILEQQGLNEAAARLREQNDLFVQQRSFAIKEMASADCGMRAVLEYVRKQCLSESDTATGPRRKTAAELAMSHHRRQGQATWSWKGQGPVGSEAENEQPQAQRSVRAASNALDSASEQLASAERMDSAMSGWREGRDSTRRYSST